MALSNKQVIIGAVIIGFFVGNAILTAAVGSSESEKKEKNDAEYIEIKSKNTPEVVSTENYTNPNKPAVNNNKRDQSDEVKVEAAKPVVTTNAIEGDPIEELNNLIGLEDVKAEVKSLMNIVKIQKQREAKGLKNASISYHCVFSGSPGTGKTTVARILAAIYKDLGVIKKGHLVETDRSGLIGEYVGQTGPKTNHLVDSALGGVLFIDEAYALLDSKGGGYGEEAVATLLKRMEDDRDNLVVIVAGYKDEMKKFIDSNPGLQSRFTRYIDFPDYSSEELYKIFRMRSDKYKYVLDADADATLRELLDEVVASKSKNFGNGRYVRNLFEMCTTQQANRLGTKNNVSEADLCQITREDVLKAYKLVKQ